MTSLVTLGGIVFKTSTMFSSGLRCFIFLLAIMSSATFREIRLTPGATHKSGVKQNRLYPSPTFLSYFYQIEPLNKRLFHKIVLLFASI